MLRKRVEKIKQEKVKHVIIEDVNKVAEKFIERYPKLKPRYQRDIESQELGIPPFVYNFFKEVIEPLWKEVNPNNENQIGLTRKQIIAKYYEVYGRAIQNWVLRQEILPALECAGLIFEDVDPNDKRRKLIYLSTPQCNSLFLNNHLPKNSEREYGVGNFFYGKCSYCGKDGEVTWFNGNLICKECLEIENEQT